jgi:hypothetical protein
MQFTARLLKSVDEREADDVFLIGTQHLNLNDEQVKDEIERIAPKLMPAVTRDISDAGNAIAEHIDGELAGDAAQQLMTLLLSSSLSRAVGGRIGLSESELIEFLAAPQRKPDEFLQAIAAPARIGVVPPPRRATLLHQGNREPLAPDRAQRQGSSTTQGRSGAHQSPLGHPRAGQQDRLSGRAGAAQAG